MNEGQAQHLLAPILIHCGRSPFNVDPDRAIYAPFFRDISKDHLRQPFEALLCFGSVHHVQVQETCQSRTGQPARRHNASDFPKVNLKYMSELSLVSANNSSRTHFLERNSSTNDR